jgi:hypothetical protein
MYDAAAHRASLHLQDAVIRILQSAGHDAELACPGFVWMPKHKKSFVHWHGRQGWQDETDASLGEKNHLDAAEVAAAILNTLNRVN